VGGKEDKKKEKVPDFRAKKRNGGEVGRQPRKRMGHGRARVGKPKMSLREEPSCAKKTQFKKPKPRDIGGKGGGTMVSEHRRGNGVKRTRWGQGGTRFWGGGGGKNMNPAPKSTAGRNRQWVGRGGARKVRNGPSLARTYMKKWKEGEVTGKRN